MGNLIKSFGYTLTTLYVILSGYTLGFVSDNGEGRGVDGEEMERG